MGEVLFWQRSRAALHGGQVEYASMGAEGVALRCSARPDGPVLTFTWDAWAVFLMGALRGDADRRAMSPPVGEQEELAWRASS